MKNWTNIVNLTHPLYRCWLLYVKICCCNFDSNTSQTCFQPSPVGDLVTIIRSSLPIQKHHLNDSKCWRIRLCIKSPHSPKPHVHPVKVYHGIRSFWNYLGANSGYFQQPPWRSLDHPINLPFPIFLGWKGWTGVIKHIWIYMFQRAHIDQSKNVPYTEIQAEKTRVVGFQPIWTTMLIKLDHPPQVCRGWFFFWCLKPPRIPRHDILAEHFFRTSAASPALFTFTWFYIGGTYALKIR